MLIREQKKLEVNIDKVLTNNCGNEESISQFCESAYFSSLLLRVMYNFVYTQKRLKIKHLKKLPTIYKGCSRFRFGSVLKQRPCKFIVSESKCFFSGSCWFCSVAGLIHSNRKMYIEYLTQWISSYFTVGSINFFSGRQKSFTKHGILMEWSKNVHQNVKSIWTKSRNSNCPPILQIYQTVLNWNAISCAPT